MYDQFLQSNNLKALESYMDIQVICNAEGAAYYVCSYICKSELDELKSALGNLIHQVFKENPSIPRYQRLLKIGLCVLRHRRLSRQEAAYRLSNLNLIHTSRKYIFVNTMLSEKRFRLLRSKKELDNLPDDSEVIFHNNMLDYYRCIPESLLKHVIINFVHGMRKLSAPTDKSRLERFYIEKYDIWIKKNTKALIVRAPNFPVNSDEYFYAMLLLLLPHRSEKDI